MTRLALAAAFVVAATGCFRHVDGGPQISETRTVDTFTRVQLQDGLKATFTSGAAAVNLTTQEQVAKNLITEVKDGTLTVRLKPGIIIDSLEWTTIAVTGTDVTSFDGSGASELTVKDVDTAKVRFTASGASQITASGKATEVTISASGASRVFAKELTSQSASVDASGASVVELTATAKVEGSASGASVVTVLGGANTSGISSSGASTVQ